MEIIQNEVSCMAISVKSRLQGGVWLKPIFKFRVDFFSSSMSFKEVRLIFKLSFKKIADDNSTKFGPSRTY